MKTRKRY